MSDLVAALPHGDCEIICITTEGIEEPATMAFEVETQGEVSNWSGPQPNGRLGVETDEEDHPTLDEVGNLFEPVEAEASPMPVEDLEVVQRLALQAKVTDLIGADHQRQPRPQASCVS